METIEKAAVTMFFDEEKEPVGIIYFNKNRERVIYVVKKASEDQMVSLYQNRDVKIKAQ